MNTKTRRLTTTALMSALTLILGLTPIGFLTIPFTTIDITLMCLPVIIGAIVIGWKEGLLLGLLFALTSLFKALTAPSPLVAALLPYPLALYPSIFIPRLLIPLVAYGVWRLTVRLPKAVSLGIAAAAGSLTNTALFLGMFYVLGAGPIATQLGMTTGAVGALLAGVVLTNGLPEAAVAVLLCVPIMYALQKVIKKD